MSSDIFIYNGTLSRNRHCINERKKIYIMSLFMFLQSFLNLPRKIVSISKAKYMRYKYFCLYFKGNLHLILCKNSSKVQNQKLEYQNVFN